MRMTTFSFKKYQGILLDVDGVIVKGRDPIPGAIETVNHMMQQSTLLFLSNNSLYSRKSYAEKLKSVGLNASEDQILHSGLLVARYISQFEQAADVFLIGHQGLHDELTVAGHRVTELNPQWLVTGNDEQINYEKLTKGLQVLLGGGRWIASNADATYPAPEGFRPGAGSLVGAFRGMGYEPEAIVGKPSLFCMNQALALLGVDDAKKVLMIGDRLDSDIEGANNAGMDSLLVFSGVTSESGYAESETKATFTKPSIDGLIEAY